MLRFLESKIPFSSDINPETTGYHVSDYHKFCELVKERKHAMKKQRPEKVQKKNFKKIFNKEKFAFLKIF